MAEYVEVGDDKQKFFRVSRPVITPEAPANIRIVPAGIADSISLAWDAVTTPGVTGYRVLYGTSPTELNQVMELGLVTSVTLAEVVAGQTYYATVITLAGSVESSVGSTLLSAMPESSPVFLPLFTAATALEPDPVIETSTAKITYLGDRVRDRHARESAFRAYDHYLSFYWEQRVGKIQIIDRVAKGGSTITFNYTTQDRLNPAEFGPSSAASRPWPNTTTIRLLPLFRLTHRPLRARPITTTARRSTKMPMRAIAPCRSVTASKSRSATFSPRRATAGRTTTGPHSSTSWVKASCPGPRGMT